jgi:hypothetical protein
MVERNILSTIDHPFIVSLKFAFQVRCAQFADFLSAQGAWTRGSFAALRVPDVRYMHMSL